VGIFATMGKCCGVYKETVKPISGYVGYVDDEVGVQHANARKTKETA
jgi:hypothetical protein